MLGHFVYIVILSKDQLFNCVLICVINQMAVEAGEELLTSVSEFEHPHCLVQDLTISKWDSFYWD